MYLRKKKKTRQVTCKSFRDEIKTFSFYSFVIDKIIYLRGTC